MNPHPILFKVIGLSGKEGPFLPFVRCPQVHCTFEKMCTLKVNLVRNLRTDFLRTRGVKMTRPPLGLFSRSLGAVADFNFCVLLSCMWQFLVQ